MSRAASAGTIELRAVTRRYGAAAVVDDVSFVIEAGALVTLLGPSGCGKTTTLRMIAGLETPSEGQVLIGGRDVTAWAPAERNVSLVFQSYALFPHLTVLDNVAYGPRVRGVRPAAAHAQARETLALLGLTGLEARLPAQLSGGQQQRVALARALVLEPTALLFDEPLSNLDARLRRRVRDEIRALQRRLGLSVVYVTHDREEALAVSDRIIVMDHGRIVEQGPPRALFETPRTRFVADFLSEASIVAGRLLAVAGESGEVDVAGHVVRVPHRGHALGEVTVAVRPDTVTLHADEGAGKIAGRVVRAAFVGRAIEYAIETAAGELFVIVPEAETALPAGQRVGLSLDARGIALVD
ncbi:MAG: ABC transporter ATP-binding protein [Candidatus Rokubacteria bacterium]|nr:ABC transporter ATP-binding protein [Candidatus Rokubacteria bacterium]